MLKLRAEMQRYAQKVQRDRVEMESFTPKSVKFMSGMVSEHAGMVPDTSTLVPDAD